MTRKKEYKTIALFEIFVMVIATVAFSHIINEADKSESVKVLEFQP